MSQIQAPNTDDKPKTDLATKPKPAPLVVNDEGPFANWLDTARFEHIVRIAQAFAGSTIIPEHYRGQPGNCMIATQMAVRLGVDPLMFMQKSYVVNGKPGIEAQLAIALVNSSGIFADALDYEVAGGDNPRYSEKSEYRVRAFAVRRSTGKTVYGPWIDWPLVKAEGWLEKKGSKWATMPSLMFMYRAASFFARMHCPERLMGMNTNDELADLEAARTVVVEKPRWIEPGKPDPLMAGASAPQEPHGADASPPADESRPENGQATQPASRKVYADIATMIEGDAPAAECHHAISRAILGTPSKIAEEQADELRMLIECAGAAEGGVGKQRGRVSRPWTSENTENTAWTSYRSARSEAAEGQACRRLSLLGPLHQGDEPRPAVSPLGRLRPLALGEGPRPCAGRQARPAPRRGHDERRSGEPDPGDGGRRRLPVLPY